MKTRPPPSILPLAPRIQHYAWGDAGFLPALLRRERDGQPWAEAWYGAHPAGPATVRGTEQTLRDLIADHGHVILGADVQARFDGLPYLVKLLAAAEPLSIQVHPDAQQARSGFARENAAGIPIDADYRNYRDDRHKPELFVALTDFHALCGFRPADDIAQALEQLPEIAGLLPPFDRTPEGLRWLIDAWFAEPRGAVETALAGLLERLAREAPVKGTTEAWALRAQQALGPAAAPDPGLLFVWLLARVELAPGEGLFLPAGIPHAYLEGAGIEVMASSDNVLRAGLTPKHVDAAELLQIVRFDAPAPSPLAAEAGRYDTPAGEFALQRIVEGSFERTARGPELLLALPTDDDHRVTVEAEDGTLELGSGEACMLVHGAEYRIDGLPGAVWLCRVP